MAQILGESPQIKNLLNLIERVAATKTSVLIVGESGTGKELVARRIHELSSLRTQPFVPVNCGAIPENLIESELFGHKKGSFTGAVNDKMGLFEVANRGTLFLDEIGELPLGMQVKLLRALQDKTIRRVGGTDDMRIEVRILAATNRNLEEGIAQGRFREDLYYRLNVIQIETPSLRERTGDVRLLAERFLERCAEKQKKTGMSFSPEALAILESYQWPGNVRELENVIERAVTLEGTSEISTSVFPATLMEGRLDLASTSSGGEATGVSSGLFQVPPPDFSKGPVNLDEILGNIEKLYLTKALEETGGIKKKAAELLGITFRSIRYRLKKLGVDSGD